MVSLNQVPQVRNFLQDKDRLTFDVVHEALGMSDAQLLHQDLLLLLAGVPPADDHDRPRPALLLSDRKLDNPVLVLAGVPGPYGQPWPDELLPVRLAVFLFGCLQHLHLLGYRNSPRRNHGQLSDSVNHGVDLANRRLKDEAP